MEMSVHELSAICENADIEVKIISEAWQEEVGDIFSSYGDKSSKELNNLTQGKCTQADQPEGCPFMPACTGKIRYKIEKQKGVIFLTVSNKSAIKVQRLYTGRI
jgi:hypothetical protein